MIFDLHAGGPPSQLLFPASVPFEPFDLAAAPDDGFGVGRRHRVDWGFDRSFQPVTQLSQLTTLEPDELADFRPVGGGAVVRPGRSFPLGFPLDAADPIAIEGLPDGRRADPGQPWPMRPFHRSGAMS